MKAARRVRAAVLGLFALPSLAPRLRAYAPAVTCPVFFIAQRDEEIHPIDRARELFDALGSRDKRFVVSDGGHMDVPRDVFEQAYAFLEERLGPTR